MSIDQVSKEVAESLGLGEAKGALVRGVEADSPAGKAGVEAGDIIVRFDGKAIDKSVGLPRMVGGTRPGTRSTVTVFRRGQLKDLTVVVGEVEPEQRQASRRPAANEGKAVPSGATKQLGLTLSDLTDAQRTQLKLKGGVRVDSVDGPAARAGLRDGDVILALGNTEVGSVKDFEAVASKLEKGRAVSLLVRRGEWAQYVVIRPNGR